ncbi:hypothetical protein AB0D78_29065 [Streptomyces avermitilis]
MTTPTAPFTSADRAQRDRRRSGTVRSAPARPPFSSVAAPGGRTAA